MYLFFYFALLSSRLVMKINASLGRTAAGVSFISILDIYVRCCIYLQACTFTFTHTRALKMSELTRIRPRTRQHEDR